MLEKWIQFFEYFTKIASVDIFLFLATLKCFKYKKCTNNLATNLYTYDGTYLFLLILFITFSKKTWVIPKVANILKLGDTIRGILGTVRGNHPTHVNLTGTYKYSCESPVHEIDSLMSPPKGNFLLWFNYPILTKLNNTNIFIPTFNRKCKCWCFQYIKSLFLNSMAAACNHLITATI